MHSTHIHARTLFFSSKITNVKRRKIKVLTYLLTYLLTYFTYLLTMHVRTHMHTREREREREGGGERLTSSGYGNRVEFWTLSTQLQFSLLQAVLSIPPC